MNENDAADENGNTQAAGNEVVNAGCFKRFGGCVKNEATLLCACARSASPDRSSAGVLFLVLFAFSLTCTLSRYLVGSQPERFPTYVVPLLIVGYEGVGIVCLVLIWRFAQPCDQCNVDADPLQPWHRLIKHNIKLFGIVLFYFALFVFDLFRLIAELKCVDAWRACASGPVRTGHLVDLVYPVARSLYLFGELIVCVKFNEVDFYQNTPVLAGLAIVQATNLSSWMDALVNESAVFSSQLNATNELWSCFNGTNISEHFERCFYRTTGEFELLKFASPYLYPFIVEYLMLVMECVADWFFSDAYRHRHGTPSSHRPDEHAQSAAAATSNGGSGGDRQLRSVTSFEATRDEQQPLQDEDDAAAVSRASLSDSVLQSDDNVRMIPSTSTSTVSRTDRQRCPQTWCRCLGLDRCPPVLFSVIMPLIASFLFVIFGIYSFSLGQIFYRNVFIYYRIGYWLSLTLAALVGYAVSRQYRSAPMNPNGFEYFVILSCIGPIVQSIFTIVANVRADLVPMGVFLAEEITNIVHICVQVVFYAYAKSVRMRTDASDDNPGFAARCKLSTLRIVISSFALCNFAIWVEDSFIETRDSENSWQKQYFEDWPIIYNTFNPLALIFRFNSVLLFLNVLFEKGR